MVGNYSDPGPAAADRRPRSPGPHADVRGREAVITSGYASPWVATFENKCRMPGSRPHQAKAARPRSSRRLLPARGLPRGPRDFPVVGIGASAGGLESCRKLVDALPAGNGMAFILVQDLDPTDESMMADLLACHTSMPV